MGKTYQVSDKMKLVPTEQDYSQDKKVEILGISKKPLLELKREDNHQLDYCCSILHFV